MEATLTNAASNEASYDLDTLRGARFVSFSETRSGHGLARVKRLTGGDTMKARATYGMPYDFLPQFSLWLPTNHLPVISPTAEAMWNRVRVFPFSVVIPKKKRRDQYSADIVAKHGPGVLGWLVDGAREYLESEQLGEQPTAMGEARERWRENDDLVGRWLRERTIPNPAGKTVAARLFADFRDWLEDMNEQRAGKSYTAQGFNREMDAHYDRGKSAKGGSFWREGVVLVSDRS
jgi:putative DNA primase/helicase